MISVILKLIKKLIRYLFARAVKIRAASGRDLKAQEIRNSVSWYLVLHVLEKYILCQSTLWRCGKLRLWQVVVPVRTSIWCHKAHAPQCFKSAISPQTPRCATRCNSAVLHSVTPIIKSAKPHRESLPSLSRVCPVARPRLCQIFLSKKNKSEHSQYICRKHAYSVYSYHMIW